MDGRGSNLLQMHRYAHIVSCVGCAGSEGRALRRQSLQDKMHTMTPGASKASGAAAEPAARMTRAACRKLAVAG